MKSFEIDALPRDYRATLKTVVIVIGLVSPPILYAHAMETKLEKHLAEVEALRPTMTAAVRDIQAKLTEIDRKTERLLEDCYRRGGCNDK